jgi:hypothetical protein
MASGCGARGLSVLVIMHECWQCCGGKRACSKCLCSKAVLFTMAAEAADSQMLQPWANALTCSAGLRGLAVRQLLAITVHVKCSGTTAVVQHVATAVNAC